MNKKLIEMIQNKLHPKFLKKEYRNGPQFYPDDFNDLKLYGHCYVASETYYHMSGEKTHLKSHFIKWLGTNHWFLKSDQGEIIDVTAGQFREPVNYSKGIGKGFLTKNGSRRMYHLKMDVIDSIKREGGCEEYTGMIQHGSSLRWYKDGLLHREDGPAIVVFNEVGEVSYRFWYLEDKQTSSQEVFERLSPEQKEKVIWDLDQWK